MKIHWEEILIEVIEVLMVIFFIIIGAAVGSIFAGAFWEWPSE